MGKASGKSDRKGELASFFLLASVPGSLDAGVVIAAGRCGETGILNLEAVSDGASAQTALLRVSNFCAAPFGVKFDPASPLTADLLRDLPENASFVVLASGEPACIEEMAEATRRQGRHLLIEVTSAEQAMFAVARGAEGLIAKGHEAGGRVGEETCFVLLQHVLAAVAEVNVPVWAQGGIGPHSAAACYTAGAAGVVLDSQLLLTPESSLPAKTRLTLERMEADETIALGRELGLQFRFYKRAGAKAVADLQRIEQELLPLPLEAAQARWKDEVAGRMGWGSLENHAWPLGQDGVFAARFARRYYNVAGVVKGVRESIRQHVDAAQKSLPLRSGSLLAQAHRTTYPILQGPMTRVSDTAPFAAAVAENGALPFLALALLRGPQVRKLLEETRTLLGDKPWGVGILGFVPLELRTEQLAVVREIHPAFCIIAGGRPDQAKALEQEGITTYLHVPAPALLRIFVEDGARRFIFEGRECGGHVGPRTSFVLWEEMIDVLLSAIAPGTQGSVKAEDLHVVFAGGIHDARSAAMVAAMAAPLVEKGVRVGVLIGTAYLFTDEAVSGGAIVEGFQKEAVGCTETVLLESGAGHTTRCAPSKFVDTFRELKVRMAAEGKSALEIRDALEDLNIGRLRIASKGINRAPAGVSGAADFVKVAPEQQLAEGMYMIGQVAALRNSTCTMRSLHEDVATGSSALLTNLTTPLEAVETRHEAWAEKPCDVAIIGMSCLLPGARDTGAFWTNLLNKADVISDIPKERFDADLYYDPDRKARDKIVSKRGGFLGNVPFDPMRFGIPPNALSSIDPMQLLTLVAVDEALKDAAYDIREFPRERTSVILGLSGGLGDLGIQYAVRSTLPMHLGNVPAELMERLPEWTEDSFAGILLNVVAGRVANRFNFGGVNFTVDAACASSLAAVYVAARELVAGSSDMVVVGGVDTVQSPFGFLCFSKSQALSPSGQCSTFDESADGIAISEGLSVLVMKRLEDAERDGDRIYAVLKGVAGSSDGRGKSMTAPRLEGQVLAMQRAYRQAGIRPSTVSMIEAHGTGTVAGDATETASLSTLFLADGAAAQSCAIGSVKSQIGHTKSAAGSTGLMKAALALHHRVLPPTLHVEKPNKKLQEAGSPFFPNVDAQRWLRPSPETPRRAGISSFGFGGTNFHAVLEEYTGNFKDSFSQPGAPEWPAELFLWRAASKEAILQSVAVLEKALGQLRDPVLRDLAAACSKADRGAFALAIVATSIEDLRAQLVAARAQVTEGNSAQKNKSARVFFGEAAAAPKIAFLFPGQGSQYPGMLRELALYFPEFLTQLELADAALAGRYPQRLSSYIYPPPAFTEEEKQRQAQALTDTVVAQPALGVVEIALHQWLERVGVHPDMTAGHSYGEYVALAAAGALSPNDLHLLSETRGRAIKDSVGANAGTMAAVAAGGGEVQRALNGTSGVSIANFNSPRQTIIAGSSDAVQSAIGVLSGKGLTAKHIPVACAFHSPLMQPAADRLAASLSQQHFATTDISVYSNTLATKYPAGSSAIASLLGSHLTEPVRFDAEIEALYEDGARVFVEVGPKGVLSGLTRQILGGKEGGKEAVVLQTDVPGANAVVQILTVLAQLAVCGVPIEMDELFRERIGAGTLDLSRLPAPAAESVWMVDGSRAFLRSQPPVAVKPISVGLPGTPAPIAMPVQTPSQPAAQPANTVPPMPAVAPGDAEAVMLQFQQMMSQFLQTQASVMTAFLGGAAAPAVAVPAPAPAAVITPVPTVAAPAPLAAPAPVAPPAQPVVSGKPDIAAQLLGIVSEKTGYPIEMLDLEAGVEADLGIDSIKRIEILSGFKRLYGATEQAAMQAIMERLTRARSLRDMVAGLSEAIGAREEPAARQTAIPTSAPTAVSDRNIASDLLRIVSDKTGYPAEMLDVDAGIESDLGIDSIKRIEILSAVQRTFNAPEQAAIQKVMEQLTRGRSLREMAGTLTGAIGLLPVAAPVTGAALPVQAPPVDVAAQLLTIVSDKTGYPAEMLDVDAGIESDLGIDSIKRIEILNAAQRLFDAARQPAIQAAMEQLTRARTLRELARSLSSAVTGNAPGPTAAPQPAATPAQPGVQQRELPRFELTTVEIARVATAAPAAFAGRVSLITDDETGLAARLADEWTRSGQQVVLFRHGPDMPVATESVFSLDLTSAEAVQSAVEKIRSKYGAIGALVHLLPLRARPQAIPGKLSEWRDQVRQDVRSLYLLTRAVDADLRQVGKSKGALLAVVTGRGGEFGLQPLVSTTPADFAAADFLKTAALEFPEVLCKAIDVDPGDPLPILSRKLQEELDLGDDTLQIGLPGDRRLTVAPRLAELQSSVSPKIEQDWVCLLTGGARGITAQIARKLAAKCRPTLILAGASAIDNAPEPPGIQGIADPPKLKGALLAHLRASNPAVKPADVEAAYQQILRRREIQGTLNALRAMGSRVEYHAVDVRDEAAFGGLIGNIYQAHGRLDLVIHGAGIIEDKLIRDKTPESFDRVVHTKSDSSWLLTRYLRKDTLKCLIFMSSITAAFGNRGQADYAAANGIMNGLAVLLAAQWPCHVVAMNWGPWDQGGMVSEEVRQQFLTLGVQLIAPEAGAEAVLLEIESPEKGHPLAVFGDGPWSKTLVSGVRPASARIAGKAAGKVAG